MKRQFKKTQRKPSRKIKPFARQSTIQSKLLMTLGLSIVLAILVMIFFKPGEATNEPLPSEFTNNSTIPVYTWARKFEGLMKQNHFNINWINGFDKIRNYQSPQPERFLLTLNYPSKYRIN